MRALAVLIVLLLSGCTRPAETSGAPGPSCGQRFAGPPGDNATLLASLRDDADVVADRIAAVAGDRVTGPPEALQDGELRFPTANGSASYWRAGDAPTFDARAEWTGRADWGGASSRDVLARLLDAFQLPQEWVAVREGTQASFAETYRGEAIRGAGGWALAGDGGGLSIGPVYEVRPRTEPMDAARAAGIAREYAACAWSASDAGALPAEDAGLGVRDGSLTRVVLVRDPARADVGHCGVALDVHVDAATGAVRGAEPPACD